MNNPLVSIIITTKNENSNIVSCLESLLNQTYISYEIIVVDNASRDNTKELAKKFTPNVFDKGPERSAQRNFGGRKARGKYLLFLDADMILEKNVVKDCVRVMQNQTLGGVIIPEESFGTSFWAKVKGLERSFYVGDDAAEAARFFDKDKFFSVGGFDEHITGPEDWDLSQRIKQRYSLSRISSYILHNEGDLSFSESVRKKYYYAKKAHVYLRKDANKGYVVQKSILKRYWTFLSHPRKMFNNPILGMGVLAIKTAELSAGLIGYIEGKLIKK